MRQVTPIQFEPAAVRKIHLDAVGGIAGDMFAAAHLHACPQLWPGIAAAITAMAPPAEVQATMESHNDGVLQGQHFRVSLPSSHEHHHHIAWSQIRSQLQKAPLPAGIREQAVGIFQCLAEAEAHVHGLDAEAVSFHEVGAWDSIIDIVAAAVIIDALSPCAWSVGALPRGCGLIDTRHGQLPSPAPAVLALLPGYTFTADEEQGERVTPTGAAILAWLGASQAVDPAPLRFLASGIGFGTRRLKNRPNILRAAFFADAATDAPSPDQCAIVRFEIDDQTGEELAVALDLLRSRDGVIDVCQWPVFGKQGRLAAAVQILCDPAMVAQVSEAIFRQTTTLGLRVQTVPRMVLRRRERDIDGISVKIAERPGGATAKAAIADLAGRQESPQGGQAARQQLRRKAESAAVPDGQDASDDTEN